MKILTENAEYTSRKKAEKYLLNTGFFNSDQNRDRFGGQSDEVKQAIDYYLRIYLRDNITSLRTRNGGKYLFGCVRIIHDEGLHKKEYIKLNNIIRTIIDDEKLFKSIDDNFNGMEFNDLYDKMIGYINEFSNKKISNNKPKNENYSIIEIDTHSKAHEFEDYTTWCVCGESDNYYNRYTYDGSKTIYFAIRKDFKETKKPIDKSGNQNDEYATSMICIIVDENGNLTDSVSRYNHSIHVKSGDPQNTYTVDDLENILGCNFIDTFRPNPKTESDHTIAHFKSIQDKLEDVMLWFEEDHFGEPKDDYELNGEYLRFDDSDIYASCLLIENRTNKENNYYRVTLERLGDYGTLSYNVEAIYSREDSRFLTQWSRDVSILNNSLIATDMYYKTTVKNLESNKVTFKINGANNYQKSKNAIIFFDNNGKISLIDSNTSKVVEQDKYYDKYTTLMADNYRYLIIASAIKQIKKNKLVCGMIFDKKDCKFITKSPIYTISPKAISNRLLAPETTSSIVYSYNEDLSNPIIHNLSNANRKEIPFIGIPSFDYISRYLTITDIESNEKTIVYDEIHNEIVLESETPLQLKQVRNNISSFTTYNYNGKNQYTIWKNNKIFIDNISYLQHPDKSNSVQDYYIITVKDKGNALFDFRNYKLYKNPDYDGSWFKEIRAFSSYFVCLSNDGEEYQVQYEDL